MTINKRTEIKWQAEEWRVEKLDLNASRQVIGAWLWLKADAEREEREPGAKHLHGYTGTYLTASQLRTAVGR